MNRNLFNFTKCKIGGGKISILILLSLFVFAQGVYAQNDPIDVSGIPSDQTQNEALKGTVKNLNSQGTYDEYDISDLDVSGYYPASVGTQEIKIKYGDKEATATINVVENEKKFYGLYDAAAGIIRFGFGTVPQGAVEIKHFDCNMSSSLLDKLVPDANIILNKVIFEQSVEDFRPTDMHCWFFGRLASNVREIDGMNYLHTEYVNDMTRMFEWHYSTVGVKTLDLSSFNTKNVRSMIQMFYGSGQYQTIYVGDNWVLSDNVLLDDMFANDQYANFCLFGGKGTYIANTTGELTKEQCRELARIDGGTQKPGLFSRKGEAKKVTINFTTLPQTEYVLDEAFNYDNGILSVNFEGQNPVAFEHLAYVGFSGFDNTKTGKQTITAEFQGVTTTYDITVTDNKAPYSEFNSSTGILTLYYCKYRNGLRHFSNGLCKDVEAVKKVVIDPSIAEYKPKSCSSWFSGMKNLIEIEGMQYLNAEDVTDMSSMFYNCSSLTSLDLGNVNASKLKTIPNIFNYCNNLTTIYVTENWSLSDDSPMPAAIFWGCNNLVGEQGTHYSDDFAMSQASYSGYDYTRIDGGESAPGYFTALAPVSIAIEQKPKTDYLKGEEFSANGGSLNVIYNSGRKQSVELSKATITGFDKTKKGEQSLTVNYLDLTTTLTVSVSDNSNPSTPVAEIQPTDVRIWSFGNTIYVENATDNVCVVTISGTTVCKRKASSSRMEIAIDKPGIYIVKTGKTTQKVIVE